MKNIVLMAVVLIGAANLKVAAQDSTRQYPLTQLLTQYYSLKDALVAGDGKLASAKAGELIKAANSIDYKLVSEGNINALLHDATPISETRDISTQRIHFSNLSNNMVTLAKALKLTSQPVYLDYCPMKNANWLSNDKEIRNPYYGNTMLNCGRVVEAINQ